MSNYAVYAMVLVQLQDKNNSVVVALLHTVQILVYYSLGLRTWDRRSLP